MKLISLMFLLLPGLVFGAQYNIQKMKIEIYYEPMVIKYADLQLDIPTNTAGNFIAGPILGKIKILQWVNLTGKTDGKIFTGSYDTRMPIGEYSDETDVNKLPLAHIEITKGVIVSAKKKVVGQISITFPEDLKIEGYLRTISKYPLPGSFTGFFQ